MGALNTTGTSFVGPSLITVHWATEEAILGKYAVNNNNNTFKILKIKKKKNREKIYSYIINKLITTNEFITQCLVNFSIFWTRKKHPISAQQNNAQT